MMLAGAAPIMATDTVPGQRPRLGFLGVGWIGRYRLKAIHASGLAAIVAVGDTSAELAAQAAAEVPGAVRAETLDDLLALDLDGLVIATPSALHASQSIAAFEHGLAVFCQKPLARTAAETRRVVDAARAADRLLGVDFSYRHVTGVPEVRSLIQAGSLGRIYAASLVFHNAYGPDKPWFYDPRLSGGGCVMDLGIHLVDLALWLLDYPRVEGVTSRLYSQGQPLSLPQSERVEDYAAAQLELAGGLAEQGAVVQLACSWRLPAGRPAVIEAAFYGTEGGAALRNVDGSFFDFTVERFNGTEREVLASPPDEWGGRAAVSWLRHLANDRHFDPKAERLIEVAQTLDAIYCR